MECARCAATFRAEYLPHHIRYVHHALPDTDDTEPPCIHRDKRRRTRGPVSLTSIRWRVKTTDPLVCPISDCPTWTPDYGILLAHIAARHPTDHFTFDDYPDMVQCLDCGLCLRTPITSRHHNSARCHRLAERRERFLSRSQAVASAAQSIPIRIGDGEVEYVDSFPYLGRILSKDDSDDLAAYARCRCVMPRAHRLWKVSNLRNEYPPTQEVLDACGLQPLAVYIQCRRKTLLQHYATTQSPLYRSCLTWSQAPKSGAWWQQKQ